MRIAIVDDETDFSRKVKQELKNISHSVAVECFPGGSGLLARLEEHSGFDLCLLDVEMPDMTGIDLARKIRMFSKEIIIIFLTSHEKYAVVGYTCHAYGYITKDNWKNDLMKLLKQIQDEMEEKERKYYIIQSDRKYDKICMDDIYYIEKNGKNTNFYCRDEKVYSERIPLGEAYKRLPAREFLYVNRGQIVNLKYVTHVDNERIELVDKIVLLISRRNVTDIRKKLMDYWSGLES